MEYTYQTFKYNAAERQEKVQRQQVLSNQNKENRGKEARRRR